jgi:multidrug efflux pump subunit AcrA (membrane-fusion protein)
MKGILISACLLLLLHSCKKKQESIKATVQTITESVYASGNLKSKDQYQVFSSVNGIIQNIYVKEGDPVRKGQTLITLVNDASRLSAENARIAAEYSSLTANRDKLNELRIKIDLAKSKLQNDSMLLARQRALWAQEIGSRNELEQRELAYKNSRTAYESAVLRYRDLKQQVDFSSRQSSKNYQISSVMAGDYSIKAKQDGRVYSILKEKGEMVSVQTPIAVIGDASQFILELQVDEYDIARIKPGQKVFVTMDSYKGRVFEATITKIDPIMNDRSRSFKVEANFITLPENLYPNLTVEANILISTKENALTIPRNYLVDDDYVVLANGEKRKVITGLKDYQKVEIVQGLSKDEEIKRPVE